MAGLERHIGRRPTIVEPGVLVCAGGEENLDQVRVAMLGGDMERRGLPRVALMRPLGQVSLRGG